MNAYVSFLDPELQKFIYEVSRITWYIDQLKYWQTVYPHLSDSLQERLDNLEMRRNSYDNALKIPKALL